MNSLKMIELSLTDVVIRMALAVVFGALIGLERSIKRKGFGISSNAILCLASCTISILQIQSVDILVDVVKQNSALASIISMDITRYGAQVISGVGFLGVNDSSNDVKCYYYWFSHWDGLFNHCVYQSRGDFASISSGPF